MAEVFVRSAKWDFLKIAAEMTIIAVPGSRAPNSKAHAMTAHVSIAQASAEFAGLVARAERGEEIVVMRDGRPVARLVPHREPKPLVFGDLAGLYISDDLSLPESIFDDFEKGAGS
jgi:prevent-host-death family protein